MPDFTVNCIARPLCTASVNYGDRIEIVSIEGCDDLVRAELRAVRGYSDDPDRELRIVLPSSAIDAMERALARMKALAAIPRRHIPVAPAEAACEHPTQADLSAADATP